MSLRNEALQSIASHDQMALVADYEMIAFKLEEKFGDART
jgi:hypothetical protein